jgi:hypothetical protein
MGHLKLSSFLLQKRWKREARHRVEEVRVLKVTGVEVTGVEVTGVEVREELCKAMKKQIWLSLKAAGVMCVLHAVPASVASQNH